MNDNQRAEKIALAKRKLKEFENRRRGPPSPGNQSGRCSSLSNTSAHSIERLDANCLDKEPFMVVNASGSDSLHIERQTNGSSVSSMNSSVVISNGTQDDHACPSSISNAFSSAIETRLQQERDAAVASYEQVKAQLAQLHEHYTQLHAAYSQLSGSGVHSDMENQILQLQSAVSLLVEEKTALQSELRTAKENNDQLSLEIEQVRQVQPALVDPRELQKLRSQLEQANALSAGQTGVLESLRREVAEAQARLVSVQNEKSEAQLRVKVLLKERDGMHDELTAVKKELQMKVLHLKQLSHHQGGEADSSSHELQIKTLNARVEELAAEAAALKTERDAILREADTTRKQFSEYSQELAANNNQLRQSLELSEAQRAFAENKAQELEMQISQLHKMPETEGVEQDEIPQKSAVEVELTNKISGLEANKIDLERRLHDTVQHVQKEVDARDSEIGVLKEEYSNLSIRYRQLEERLNAGRANESELLSLSDQLQSEKATVSRAVAQNKELKEQLMELEDRLVEVTNSKMQCELDKQSLEHQIRVLSEQIGAAVSSPVGSPVVPAPSAPPVEEESTGREETPPQEEPIDTTATEALAMQSEREEELEQKLQQAIQELADVRQELRRSHSRNEQMNQIMMNNAEDENQNSIHVELGQALERINILAAETDHLREQLRAAHERETELFSNMNAQSAQNQQSELAPEPVPEVTEPAPEPTPAPVVVEEEKTPGATAEVVKEPATKSEMELWARGELEKKFTEAMGRIAEMEDAMARLEHMNLQLQFENDTIGDHVILYHQQRKLIQDKLRAKDEQMAAVEMDRRRVLTRCQELQQALKEMIANKEVPCSTSSPTPVSRRVYRSYSHSTVDEMSGDEDVLVSSDEANDAPVGFSPTVRASEEGRASPVSSPSNEATTGVAMQRIMNLLDEINTPMHPAFEELQCSQCIGELKSM